MLLKLLKAVRQLEFMQTKFRTELLFKDKRWKLTWIITDASDIFCHFTVNQR